MSGIYSEPYYIAVGDKIYALQALDAPEQTSFLLKYSGELRCTITLDENGKWISDKYIDEDELNEIIKWIERLFM